MRRRNPRSGAVLCLAGAPGVGKTSLAQCTARALGRGFVKLACGGLRDESDPAGPQPDPGGIRNRAGSCASCGGVGSKDPIIVFDELDKIGRAPAAVLLEVLDPQQHKEFRDAFVELPFDLSEVLFITTANEVSEIPSALRDRLEVIELAGYSEEEKVSIARTHLVEAENRSAGLSERPVRFTAGGVAADHPRAHERAGVCVSSARCLRTVSTTSRCGCRTRASRRRCCACWARTGWGRRRWRVWWRAALDRPCAWVDCGVLRSASALHGARGERPGRIVEELRRVGARNPVFVLDEVDRLDAAGGAAAALLEAVDPMPNAVFRDRFLDLPFDLSEALFVATATSFGSTPAMLRERMQVVELPGYAETEKREIATRYLWPGLLRLHGLTADQVEVTDEAVGAVIGGYTREAGVWRLAAALGEVCAKVVRRRSEGDTAAVVVTPAQLAGDARRAPASGGRGGRAHRAAAGSPSGCAARRAASARRRSSKRAGWPAPEH